MRKNYLLIYFSTFTVCWIVLGGASTHKAGCRIFGLFLELTLPSQYSVFIFLNNYVRNLHCFMKVFFIHAGFAPKNSEISG